MSADHKLRLRIAFGGTAAFLRLYGELNDFLPPDRRGRLVMPPFDVSPSIKDAIESNGVPHPEVALIVANREPVGFNSLLQRGDYVSVYPAFHSIDLGSAPRLREALASPPGLVLDVHLGRLASYLRLLGFDALYDNRSDDVELARVSSSERRVLLTRDRGLLKRNEVVHGYWVRHTEPRRQLTETLRRFDLVPHVELFTRCLICNATLVAAAKETVAARLPERTAESFQDFHICPGCDRVYWKGSHYRCMLNLIGRTLREARE